VDASNGYLVATIAVMAAATLATRALPFLMLGRFMERPRVRYLGRYLPPAVMLLLVVYAVRDVTPWQPPYGAYQFTGIAVTALAHWQWRNALISISCGTGAFMALLRWAPLT